MLKERNVTSSFIVENFRCDGYEVVDVSTRDNEVYARIRGPENTLQDVDARFVENKVHVVIDGRDALFEDVTYAPAERKDAAGTGAIRAPMAGKIIKVAAEPGTKVAKGDLLVILEAMKMEHELRAAADGTVDSVTIKPGDQVAMRQVLVTLKQ